jgi:thioredoxin 1
MASANVLNLNDSNFDSEINKGATPILVDFWAPWCGPCRMLAPVVEKLAVEFEGKAVIAKLNTDVAGDIAGSLGVSAIPTVFIFKGGQAVARLVGVQPESKYRDELNKLIG